VTKDKERIDQPSALVSTTDFRLELMRGDIKKATLRIISTAKMGRENRALKLPREISRD
jgi:hypothetical protein